MIGAHTHVYSHTGECARAHMGTYTPVHTRTSIRKRTHKAWKRDSWCSAHEKEGDSERERETEREKERGKETYRSTG